MKDDRPAARHADDRMKAKVTCDLNGPIESWGQPILLAERHDPSRLVDAKGLWEFAGRDPFQKSVRDTRVEARGVAKPRPDYRHCLIGHRMSVER